MTFHRVCSFIVLLAALGILASAFHPAYHGAGLVCAVAVIVFSLLPYVVGDRLG